MKKIFLFLMSFNFLFANCYIVNGLKGFTFSKSDNFELSEDRISNSFEINIEGKKSSVSNSDLNIIQVGKNTLIGIYSELNRTTIETWSIYPFEKKVLYTKSINGLPILNGSRMFKGQIIGNCNK